MVAALCSTWKAPLRSVLAAAALCSNVMLRNVLAAAALCSAQNATVRCPPIRPLAPIRERVDLGGLLRHRNLTGDGVEIGVQQGLFTGTLLRGWRRCGAFVQVDPWRPLGTTGDRAQAAGAAEHAANREFAGAVLDAAVDLGYARSGEQCADTSDACAALYGDGRFDFVYVDAGHDRRSVLGDLARWWPKLRAGGVMAGHDYTEQREPSPHEWAAGQQKGAKFPTSKAPFSAVFHSFRLIFGRAIISRNCLEAWMLFPEHARAEHSR